MFTQITFYQILDLPLIAWGGMFTFLLLVVAALIGYYNAKGLVKPPLVTLQGHKALAAIALISGLLHGILGLLAFL